MELSGARLRDIEEAGNKWSNESFKIFRSYLVLLFPEKTTSKNFIPVILHNQPFGLLCKMSSSLKPNIGVYTNPAHDLWIKSAEPKAEGLEKGETLQPGEVTVGIKSTGICGFVLIWLPFHFSATN